MKLFKLSLLFTILISMVGVKALAYSFKVNGIYYNITNSTNKTVSVTFQNFYSPRDEEDVPSGYYYVLVDYGGDDDYDIHYNYHISDYSGNISIPSKVTYNGVSYQVTGIGYHAFENCFSVSSITLPSSIQFIDDYAFHGCTANTINIPYTVTTIGIGAFKNCSELTSVTLSSSLINIGTEAFRGCEKLEVIDIDASNLASIGNNAFNKCSKLNKVNLNSIDSWIKCSLENKESSPFSNGADLYIYNVETTSISFPVTSTSISAYVFHGCRNITSVTIPSQVNSIGAGAFMGCDGLFSVILKNTTPPTIAQSSFSYRGNNTLYVPHGSKSLYQAANYWKEFGNIVDISIDDVFTAKTKEGIDMTFKVTSVIPMEVQVGDGTNSAIDKTYAGKITIPSSVTIPSPNLTFTVSEVGMNAFAACNSMTSVEIPVKIRTIGNRVFYGCESLKEVVLPNSIKTIPENMYLNYTEKPSYGWTSIDGAVENIHVPSSVNWIGRYSINQCDTVVIEDGNNKLQLQDRNAKDGYWDGVFSGVKKLYVGRNTDCSSISSAGQVFTALNSSYTQLNDVIFGPQVTSAFIGTDFRYCDKVTSVTCLAKQPFPSPDFYQIPQTAVLKVPLGSKQYYESATGWSDFNSIEEVTEVSITMTGSEMIYSSDFDLDFSHVDGLKAYVVGEYNDASSTIILKHVQIVPAGKGVILKGAEGIYTVPCTNVETTLADSFFGTISGKFIRSTQEDNVNFVYDKANHVFKAVDEFYGCQLSRNEAYLSLPATSVSSNRNIRILYSDGRLSINETTVHCGSQFTIPVLFQSESEFGGLQCEVTLPEGVTLSKVTKTERLSEAFTLTKSLTSENTYQILLYNIERATFAGTDGALFNLVVDVDENVVVDDYEIQVKNVVASDVDGNETALPDINGVLHVAQFLIGDANNDGKINVTDIMAVASYILKYDVPGFIVAAADVNGDGKINVTDIMGIANIILQPNNANNAPMLQMELRNEDDIDPE